MRLSAPSSSRMLLTTLRAMNSMTSEVIGTAPSSALARRIAIRVSRSGAVRSAMRPHSNRLRSRSSRVRIAFGGRDHSTVLHACDKITRESAVNDELRREIAAVRELIYAD